jgi:hypothetical protein
MRMVGTVRFELTNVVALGHGGGLVEGRPPLLVGHLEEEQIRQLLQVIAVGQPVVPQDVAVVPELLNELGRIAQRS